jgi:hypothetical protein
MAGLRKGETDVLSAVEIVHEHDRPRLIRVVRCQDQELVAVSISADRTVCDTMNDRATANEAAELAHHIVVVGLGINPRGIDDDRAETAITPSIW